MRYDNYTNTINYCDEICKKIYHKKYFSHKKCIKCFIKFYDFNTVTMCSDCSAREKFYASSPDEKFEYYGITKLRYLAILKNIQKAEKIKTCRTLRKHLKAKVSNTDFPIKLV